MVMNILYFTQFYSPESIAGAFRAADHAKLWVQEGHDVTVFTGWPNYPAGKIFDGYEVGALAEEHDGSVRILRSRSLIRPNTSFRKRVISGTSFLAYGALNCLVRRRRVGVEYDIVLASCGPVFPGLLGRFYAGLLKTPLVVEFRDITYKQMVATGTRPESWKVRLMKGLELSLCRKADHVVVLTNGFMDVLESEGIPAGKMSVVPNGADTIPCEHRWPQSGRLRLGYFGTMGISQDVPTTLAYAKTLVEEGMDISYLLIGEGAARALVEKGISSGSYRFAMLMHGVSKDELEPRYAQVDMTVVSLQKSESFAATIPSKIFQSFARGVPVLFVGPEGEAANLVRESGAGIALCGTELEDVRALSSFASSEDLAERLCEMSANAVSFMESRYTRRRMAEKMLHVLSRIADRIVSG